MKIVIITPYWLNTKGGITTVVYNLCNEVKRNGHAVWILTPDGGSGAFRVPRQRSVMVLGILKALWGIKPAVIHVHAHGSLLVAPVIYKILLNRRTRIIFTFHTQPQRSSFFTGEQVRERDNLRRGAFNYLLKYCDIATCVSRSLKESLVTAGIKIPNSVVIANGVEAKIVAPEDIRDFKQKYNLTNAYPLLCMVSVLHWDWKAKGVEILIQAFKTIRVFQPEARLLIVGDGHYRKILEAYAQTEEVERQVIFTGNMDNPFVALSACDIYCHISLNEALPIAPLEAMHTGKPIVASIDGGLPEIITDGFNGILVDSNAEAVIKAILSLIKKPDFMRYLAQNATITARARFSWPKIAEEYIRAYKSEL